MIARDRHFLPARATRSALAACAKVSRPVQAQNPGTATAETD